VVVPFAGSFDEDVHAGDGLAFLVGDAAVDVDGRWRLEVGRLVCGPGAGDDEDGVLLDLPGEGWSLRRASRAAGRAAFVRCRVTGRARAMSLSL